ncbi:hypothetical protein D9758_017913 [Tetrapyrgos nigripes]|uniref:Uncharacterized protein n=1 Tax=Tetrapyrgos nigripes TaxID=182062 RepID=A0A8H5FEQ3_9AGAR|nr:hypothetical protein D9758_017913 [Tetrapyrgos nigripes]
MFWKNPYKKLTTLSGPQNAVLSVSFSIDGTFVSAAGQAVPTPHLPYAPFERKHVCSSSAWFFFEESEKHVVIFGNMVGQVNVWYWDGLLHMFRMSESQTVYRNHPEHVMSMDVLQGRVPTNKDGFFVTSTNDNSVGVWKLNSKLVLSNVFKVGLPPTFVPRTVQFCQASCTVFAFSKAGGSFLQINGSTGEPAWIRKEGPDCMDSVDLDEGRAEPIITFQNKGCNVGDVKQVAFAEDGSTLVVGTDSASAEVFSLDSGKRVQSLSYPGGSFSSAVDAPATFADLPATVPVTERELVTYIDFDTVQVTFTFKLESYNPPGTSSVAHSEEDEELTTIALH